MTCKEGREGVACVSFMYGFRWEGEREGERVREGGREGEKLGQEQEMMDTWR